MRKSTNLFILLFLLCTASLPAQDSNKAIAQLNRYVKLVNDYLVDLDAYYNDAIRFKQDFARYEQDDKRFQGFRQPDQTPFTLTDRQQLKQDIDTYKPAIGAAEHTSLLSPIHTIEEQIENISLLRKYMVEYVSENNNKVSINKQKPPQLINDMARCFDAIYVAKEQFRNTIIRIYKTHYALAHPDPVLNQLQRHMATCLDLAHEIQLRLRNTDTTQHKTLTLQLIQLHDSLQAMKTNVQQRLYPQHTFLQNKIQKSYTDLCWAVKRFCNFSEDFYNNDRFVTSDLAFYKALGEKWFPLSTLKSDIVHNNLLVAQICDNELVIHYESFLRYMDGIYLNTAVIGHHNHYVQKYKSGKDTALLQKVDSVQVLFLHPVKEPYVFRGTSTQHGKADSPGEHLCCAGVSSGNSAPHTGTGINFRTVAVGSSVHLSNVLFELSQPVLLPASYPVLNELAGFLVTHPTTVVRLDGHTDYVGNKKANKQLSKARVERVKAYLIEKGAKDKQIKLDWFGGSKPLVFSELENERAVNRRVELTILEK